MFRLVLAAIGNIVRRARERLQIDLSILSKKTEIPEDTLRRLESGEAGISTAQLTRLAPKLGLEPLHLLRGTEHQRFEPSVFLRHEGMLPDFDYQNLTVLDDAVQQGQWLRELGLLLQETREEGLQFSTEAVREDPLNNEAAKQGYRLARLVRQGLEQPNAPLMDLRELLEKRFQIAVLVRVLHGPSLPAISVRTERSAAVILNATNEARWLNPLLDRVHLAHELCHLLFDHSEGGVHLVVESEINQQERRAEQRARAFAAELLLPLSGLEQLLGPPSKTSAQKQAEELVTKARQHFGTPVEVTVNHLSNLAFLSANMRERLRLLKMEPISWATTLPTSTAASLEVTARTLRVYSEGRLTDSEVRELLGIDLSTPLPTAF